MINSWADSATPTVILISSFKLPEVFRQSPNVEMRGAERAAAYTARRHIPDAGDGPCRQSRPKPVHGQELTPLFSYRLGTTIGCSPCSEVISLMACSIAAWSPDCWAFSSFLPAASIRLPHASALATSTLTVPLGVSIDIWPVGVPTPIIGPPRMVPRIVPAIAPTTIAQSTRTAV